MDKGKLIMQLYSGSLFLQNRANAAAECNREKTLNDYDIGLMLDVSKVCYDAAVLLEKQELKIPKEGGVK